MATRRVTPVPADWCFRVAMLFAAVERHGHAAARSGAREPMRGVAMAPDERPPVRSRYCALWHNETPARHNEIAERGHSHTEIRYADPAFRYAAPGFRYAAP
jgi:hypothetical protein